MPEFWRSTCYAFVGLSCLELNELDRSRFAQSEDQNSMAEFHNDGQSRTRRLLVIDDNEGTHHDFRKILADRSSALDNLESLLFEEEKQPELACHYQIDSAFQGQDGLEMVRQANLEGKPYELAFVDLRMPPGWDGIETITHIWEVDPLLPVVLCAAFLGQSHADVIRKLGRSQGLCIVEKPFESAQIQELARTITDQRGGLTTEAQRHRAL
jgi:CheY-like chemotaxis protein